MTEAVNPTSAPAVLRAPQSRAAVLRFLVIAVIVLAADLALKWYAFNTVTGAPIDGDAIRQFADQAIPKHGAVPLVPHVLSMQLTLNQGAVFGIGQGGRWVFVAIAFVACAVILRIFWMSRAADWKLHIALALVTGGAIGNLYDRFSFGMVRDMLFLLPDTNLPFGWSWPDGSHLIYPWIFNFADAALCVGIGAIVLGMLFGKHEAKKPKTT